MLRALDTITSLGSIDARTVVIGATTIALVVALERTRLGQLGLIVAIVITSAAVIVLGWDDVARLSARALQEVDSKLVIVSADARVIDQLAATGVLDVVGTDNVYEGDEWVGHTVRRARDDARDLIDQGQD